MKRQIWFYNRSGANLLTVLIFHAAMNTFPFLLPYYPPALVIVIVILFAITIIFTDRLWRPRPSSTATAPGMAEQ